MRASPSNGHWCLCAKQKVPPGVLPAGQWSFWAVIPPFVVRRYFPAWGDWSGCLE